MDTALTLRVACEEGKCLENDQISSLLSQSALVRKLTTDFVDHPLFAVFRIMGLSEIPYMERLPYTQKMVDYINRNIATAQGFSCLGGMEEIVPCYNAMLLEAYCRLGLADSKEAQAALSWIEQYQLFERNQTTSWPHKGVCKHGGCLGKTPCYIGISKTVRALTTYSEFVKHENWNVEKLLVQGTGYMLRHKMFQRLSDGKPISAHITDIMFPQSYALSLTDLTYIVGKRQLMTSEDSSELLHLLQEKQIAENQWKIDYLYSYKGYVGFESKRKASEWVSALFPIWLSKS
ncbi:hypothetical protein [Desulfitobacterium hafniense]|uniref:Uncharacterized protein n=2 Tax=Desulfitobacterium hafniense TaxID=49338 RepID=Q252F7_DESHY|nr:hypothetical protein [Desulfitobacterium hafniense]KTE90276.1 hypothetical protein AT727_24685 [Desulfitobacterium hafniense]BAE81835.1 hypothetical protein DSY0046 [Desulfitobacterium hafniense Y51]